MKQLAIVGIVAMGLLFSTRLSAQDTSNNKFGKGIKLVAKDSSFALKFGLRTQSLYVGMLNLETNDYADRVLIRRARLKFDGYAYSPKLTYKVELGLSNSDISGADISEQGNAANIILDAVLKYNFAGRWSVWFGQTKLPGNIERTVSSSKLQFVDRSRLNSRYTIDRDMGIQLHYDAPKLRFISALSTGEGRNLTVENRGGYDFTNRIEWLPFGAFTGKSEYSLSDLKREKTPKLMIGIAYDYNQNASRSRGQKGDFIDEQKTLKTLFVDAHFKYNGFSAMAEFADKHSVDVESIEQAIDYINPFYVGSGVNVQGGYLFKRNIEIAVRYTNVTPLNETGNDQNTQYTVGLSKYIVGHALKVQSDATWIQEDNKSDVFMYRFQVELSL